jgi:integrase/recombinase XerD
MTFNSHASTTQRPARKSPLRAAQLPATALSPVAGRQMPARREGLSGADLRRVLISEYGRWLQSRTNKHHRPFQQDTVLAYTETARALDRWMSEQDIDGDFTACDTPLLNRFFAAYIASHGQGGTNTRQRNLRHLFTWLEEAYGHPHPYTDKLHRYSPVKTRPSTLAHEFIKDLLTVTGAGRARGFEDTRDHAIIRMLTEGVRRAELAQQQTGDLSADLIAQPFVRVIPLKGARASSEGRIVPLATATSRAVVTYLRVRRSHGKADSPYVWLGTNNRGPMTGSGVYRMLKRRAAQAGYEPDVHPHQFRHTFANDWLESGGAEGDLMRLMGWSDRSMLDRYGADLAVHRAVEAKRRMGDLY